jgi:hypothetical protein
MTVVNFEATWYANFPISRLTLVNRERSIAPGSASRAKRYGQFTLKKRKKALHKIARSADLRLIVSEHALTASVTTIKLREETARDGRHVGHLARCPSRAFR